MLSSASQARGLVGVFICSFVISGLVFGRSVDTVGILILETKVDARSKVSCTRL